MTVVNNSVANFRIANGLNKYLYYSKIKKKLCEALHMLIILKLAIPWCMQISKYQVYIINITICQLTSNKINIIHHNVDIIRKHMEHSSLLSQDTT